MATAPDLEVEELGKRVRIFDELWRVFGAGLIADNLLK
jgi:hypothetical protein